MRAVSVLLLGCLTSKHTQAASPLPAGLDPATLKLTASRSNQLSYGSLDKDGDNGEIKMPRAIVRAVVIGRRADDSQRTTDDGNQTNSPRQPPLGPSQKGANATSFVPLLGNNFHPADAFLSAGDIGPCFRCDNIPPPGLEPGSLG